MKKKRIIGFGALVGTVLFILYLFIFFQKGILFENAFLRLKTVNNNYEYAGTCYGEKVSIFITNDINDKKEASIKYSIGDIFEKDYIVRASNIEDRGTDLQILKNNSLLFDGIYRSMNGYYKILTYKDGKPYMGDIRVTFNNLSPFNASYEVSYNHIAETVFRDNIIIRGNLQLFIIALLLLLFVAVDMKWPLLFFNMRYALSVNNPEPSEFFVAIQRISWVAVPVISVIILIAALFVR